MAAKRRLTDLYVVGLPVVFDDGSGEPIEIFVRKLNPIDNETAVRHANAARSRVQAIHKDPTDPEYQAEYDEVKKFNREDLEAFLVEDERVKVMPPVEAEVAADEQWDTDSYLAGLRDAWAGGLDETYALKPDDPDAKRVFGEMKRFTDQVDEEVEARIADFRAELDNKPDEVLRERVLEKFFTLQAQMAWLTEFRRCEIWLATREPDQKTLYFESREEVDGLPLQVLSKIGDVYRGLTVDPTEGKDSPATEASSPSSGQPEKPEQESPSGLTAVSA